jgi:hypothetical protein
VKRFPVFVGAPLIGALLLGAGCAAPRLAPVDVSEPGWSLSETPAVWRPRRDAPELVGELIVAVHRDGRRLVQFHKQTVPVVTAQTAPEGWRLSSPLRPGAHGGTGRPTTRVPWFQIHRLPPDPQVKNPWRLSAESHGAWRLSNPRTGEFVEGLAP